MAKAAQKLNRETFLKSLVITFSFVVPILSLVVCLIIFMRLGGGRPGLPGEKIEEGLTPSQVLNNKLGYNGQKLVIRGKVSPEPAVCEKKECPTEDPCCGCPLGRHLFITDVSSVLSQKAQGRLRLLDTGGKPLCQRKEGSCEYDCQDWKEGVAYDVSGEFFAERPPPGWQMSLEYYFLVSGKSEVRAVGLGESLGNMFGELKEMLKGVRSSGYYVIE